LKKIKVFLGGYINSTNSQNLSCKALANYIDKDKFSVLTLEAYNGNLKREKNESVISFYCFYPAKISSYLGFLWGIWNCDVAFLPRGNHYKWIRFLLKLFKKRSFKTIENVLDETVLPSVAAVYGSIEDIKEGYAMCDRLYSLSRYMKDYNYTKFGIKSEEAILNLATDTSDFINKNKNVSELKNIIFIGNDMIRKGISDYLKVAENFPDLNFHIVGSGLNQFDVNNYVSSHNLKNIIYHGIIGHKELKGLLKEVDLHILPSRSEGFPKVIVETAAAGIPSIVYPDYGAEEWITTWKDGVIVNTTDDIELALGKLKETPNLLKDLSRNAMEFSRKYDIKSVISDYENIIQELVL